MLINSIKTLFVRVYNIIKQKISAITSMKMNMNNSKCLNLNKMTNTKSITVIKPIESVKIQPTAFDYRSHLGQFGWEIIDLDVFVPYIYRANHKFIALRIINQKVFPNLCTMFNQEVFDLFQMDSYNLSEAEVKLYNEINMQHCNSAYGLNAFQKNERLVRLEDVMQLYTFLTSIRNRIISQLNESITNYGYLLFDKSKIIIPFIRQDGAELLPVQSIQNNAILPHTHVVQGFTKGVLIFLLKLANKDIVDTAKLRVIKLEDLKKYFYRDETFTHQWLHYDNVNILNGIKKPSMLNVIDAKNEEVLSGKVRYIVYQIKKQ